MSNFEGRADGASHPSTLPDLYFPGHSTLDIPCWIFHWPVRPWPLNGQTAKRNIQYPTRNVQLRRSSGRREPSVNVTGSLFPWTFDIGHSLLDIPLARSPL